MMIIDLILMTIGLIGLIIASISDLKTKEVPDWLNYSLIICGITLRLLYSLINKEWSFFNYGLIGFGSMFVVGNLMYYTKQWGGGDAKLLMALGAIFATPPKFINLQLNSFPFLLILFVNIMVAGAIYGIIYSIGLAIKHKKEFVKEFKKQIKTKRRKIRWSLLVAIILFISSFLINNFAIRMLLYLLIIFTTSYPYIWLFVKSVEDTCMYRYISPKNLTEGDWIAEPIIINKKEIWGPKNLGIEKEQINKIINAKIKEVRIKEGIAFVPSFLLGTLISLLWGNVLLLI